MKRADFSAETKRIIASRAAYRCSFPRCNATLIGPGMEPDQVDNIGECAHIYAAGKKGPRCNHNLRAEDLQKPENGIFLCVKHHTLIDKHKGAKYPAETLMLYKQMHEHRISEELGHISYPLMWVKRITVVESPLLKTGMSYDFTKSTIIAGTNGTGKSILMEYVYTALSGVFSLREKRSRVKLRIEMSNPIWQDVICIIENQSVKYEIKGQLLTFCPFSINIIYLRESNGRVKGDLINWIGAQMGESRSFVKSLIDGADLSHSYLVSNVWMETVRKRPYEEIRVKLKKRDDDKAHASWTLGQFSGTERYSVLFDLVIGYLRQMSRYKNTLLLIDWSQINTFDSGLMNHYFKLFHDSSSYFQTIAVMHTLWKDVDWSGWNMIKMTKAENLDVKLR